MCGRTTLTNHAKNNFCMLCAPLFMRYLCPLGRSRSGAMDWEVWPCRPPDTPSYGWRRDLHMSKTGGGSTPLAVSHSLCCRVVSVS